MTVVVPPSYNMMRARLGALHESREFNLRSLAAVDPGLVQSRFVLFPRDGLADEQRTAFVAAAESGDILQLLKLGELPDLPLTERLALASTVKYMLYGMQRREHNIDVMSANMRQLDALLHAIKANRHDHATIIRQLLQIPLGDPIGCVCPPAENHWHADANRFDMIAYEILAVNGILWEITTALGIELDDSTGAAALQHGSVWYELLSGDPYPVWKE